MDRRDVLKVAGGAVLAGVSCGYAFKFLIESVTTWATPHPSSAEHRWGMVIDLNKCNDCPSDCNACVEACRKENNVAYREDPDMPREWNVHWLRKVEVEKKGASESRNESHTGRKSVILLCNHCDKPPCAQVCPVQATYKRDDGIVIVDHHRCIGCRYCMIACPYNARYFNFKDAEEWSNPDQPKRSHGVAEACTLCAHRLDVGATPACVEACEAGAIMVGDLDDPTSDVSKLIASTPVKRIRDDLGTEPKVHYIGL